MCPKEHEMGNLYGHIHRWLLFSSYLLISELWTNLQFCRCRYKDYVESRWVLSLSFFPPRKFDSVVVPTGETPSKRSKIEKETNFNVLVNFLILMTLCSIVAIANGVLLGGPLASTDLYGGEANIPSVVLAAMTTFGCVEISSTHLTHWIHALNLSNMAVLH